MNPLRSPWPWFTISIAFAAAAPNWGLRDTLTWAAGASWGIGSALAFLIPAEGVASPTSAPEKI